MAGSAGVPPAYKDLESLRSIRSTPLSFSFNQSLFFDLFVPYHLDSPFGAGDGTDATALAIIEIDPYLTGLFIPRNTEIRAEETARLTGFAYSQPQTPLSLINGLLPS